jgi:hypothetical protein
MNFEQWQQLSALASQEQDPAKLTDLARERNVVLNQKTQTLDSLPRKPSEQSLQAIAVASRLASYRSSNTVGSLTGRQVLPNVSTQTVIPSILGVTSHRRTH